MSSRALYTEGSALPKDPLSAQQQHHHRPHIPHSPPLSTSASPPAAPSPQSAAFTPPASAPMSAQPSQTSYNTSPTIKALQPSNLAPPKRKHEDDGDDADDSTPNKRARTEEPQPEVQQWSLHRLAANLHPQSRPHGSQNLFDVYDLNSIASSVARTNDVGEKINKIRKSYEGYTKSLMGKNKAISKEMELLQFYGWPEHEWAVQKVEGHDLMDGLSSKMLQNLEKSTQMQKVDMSPQETNKWASLLEVGDYAPKQPLSQQQQPAAERPSRSESISYSKANSPNADASSRPSLRRGTKRSYRDDSFVGYNESRFVEDMDDDVDGDDDDSRKRRKRKDTAGSPSYMNHYASVSVGSGH